MKKQYLPEYQHRYNPGMWRNATPGYFNQMGRRYCDSLEEAEAAIRKVKEHFNGEPVTSTHSCGAFSITSTTDRGTAWHLAVVRTRILVREVSEWETVEEEGE